MTLVIFVDKWRLSPSIEYLIALTENFQRSDLTVVEEARAFSEYVEIEIPQEEVEGMDVDFRVEEDGSGRSRHYINFADYTTLIKGGVGGDSSPSLYTPAEHSRSIQDATEKIPGVTPTISALSSNQSCFQLKSESHSAASALYGGSANAAEQSGTRSWNS